MKTERPSVRWRTHHRAASANARFVGWRTDFIASGIYKEAGERRGAAVAACRAFVIGSLEPCIPFF